MPRPRGWVEPAVPGPGKTVCCLAKRALPSGGTGRRCGGERGGGYAGGRLYLASHFTSREMAPGKPERRHGFSHPAARIWSSSVKPLNLFRSPRRTASCINKDGTTATGRWQERQRKWAAWKLCSYRSLWQVVDVPWIVNLIKYVKTHTPKTVKHFWENFKKISVNAERCMLTD